MTKLLKTCSPAEIVAQLAGQVRQIEGARRLVSSVPISSGSPALDSLLPEGGFRRGALVEWLMPRRGSGAATLALSVAAAAAREGGAVVVIDRARLFYPPAAVALGIDLERLIVVRPANDADHVWALDQVLRSPGVAAVWADPGEQDDHTLRRWQLAAETSGALGLLLRGEAARNAPSWAEVRLLVEPVATRQRGRARRLRVELLRCRGGQPGGAIEVELAGREGIHPLDSRGMRSNDHEARAKHLAPSVAAPKARRHPRRA